MRKLKILTIFSCLLASLNVSAWWLIQPNVHFVQSNVLQATVYNPYAQWIYCDGQVYGQVQTGMWLNSWIRAWIAPGYYATTYVYANYPFYFVNFTTQVYCRF